MRISLSGTSFCTLELNGYRKKLNITRNMSKKDEMALLQQLSVTTSKMLSSWCLKSAVMFKHSNFVSKTVLYLGNGLLPFLVESYSHSGNSWVISNEDFSKGSSSD